MLLNALQTEFNNDHGGVAGGIMNKQVSKSQFKAKALELFRQVEASGEPLIVTDHGQPKLEVRRYRPSEQTPLDVLHGSLLRYDNPLDPVGVEEWDAAQ